MEIVIVYIPGIRDDLIAFSPYSDIILPTTTTTTTTTTGPSKATLKNMAKLNNLHESTKN